MPVTGFLGTQILKVCTDGGYGEEAVAPKEQY